MSLRFPVLWFAFVLAPLVACGASPSASQSKSGDGGSPEGGDPAAGPAPDAGTWSIVTPSKPVGELYDIWGSAPDNAWIAADGGLLHWDGTAWTAQTAVETHLLGSIMARVHGTAANDIWLAGLTPGSSTFSVALSHFDGTSWTTPSDKGLGYGELYGLWAIAKNDVWAVGKDEGNPVRGIVVHYDGTSWTRVHDDARADIFGGIWASAPNDVWVSGAGIVLHYDGGAWADIDLGGSAMQRYGAIYGSSPRDLWITGRDDGGSNGAIAHYDGVSWTTPVKSVAGNGYGGMWMDSLGTLWVAGSASTKDSVRGLIEVESNGAWGTASLPPSTPSLGAVWGSPAGGGVWIIGSGVILHGS